MHIPLHPQHHLHEAAHVLRLLRLLRRHAPQGPDGQPLFPPLSSHPPATSSANIIYALFSARHRLPLLYVGKTSRSALARYQEHGRSYLSWLAASSASRQIIPHAYGTLFRDLERGGGSSSLNSLFIIPLQSIHVPYTLAFALLYPRRMIGYTLSQA